MCICRCFLFYILLAVFLFLALWASWTFSVRETVLNALA